MSTWAIVPLKSPERAKSRLAPVLSAEKRRRLFFDVARRVLCTLATTPEIDRVVVVTASDEVAAFSQELGAVLISQPADTGTADAFASAVEELRSLRLERLLMMAGDLPLITVEAVQELLACGGQASGAVLVPDRRKIGTNALLSMLPHRLPPCFGEDSLRRHQLAARSGGVLVRIHESEALALDLDVPADLEHLRTRLEVSDAGDQELSWLRMLLPAQRRLAVS